MEVPSRSCNFIDIFYPIVDCCVCHRNNTSMKYFVFCLEFDPQLFLSLIDRQIYFGIFIGNTYNIIYDHIQNETIQNITRIP